MRDAVKRASIALSAGDFDQQRVISSTTGWRGGGSWTSTPEARKPPLAALINNVRRWAHALMAEPTPLAAFHSPDVSVIYIIGRQSTPSARGVARLLTAALPKGAVAEFASLGHRGGGRSRIPRSSIR